MDGMEKGGGEGRDGGDGGKDNRVISVSPPLSSSSSSLSSSRSILYTRASRKINEKRRPSRSFKHTTRNKMK